MSHQAHTRIVQTSSAKRTEFLLLLAYANYAAPDGTGSYPSNSTLAEESHVGSVTAIKYVRRRLLAKGLIRMREELSPHGTRIVDLVYEDGSNADVVHSLYPDPPQAEDDMDVANDGLQPANDGPQPAESASLTNGGGKKLTGVKNLPGKSFTPNLVVVDSDSGPGNTNNNKDSGQKTDPVKVLPPFEAAEDGLQTAEDSLDAPETDALLAEWRACRIVGAHLRPIAAAILKRPRWREEVDGLFAYWEDNKDLRVGWVVAQLRELSERDPNERAEWGELPAEEQVTGWGPAWQPDYLDRFKDAWPYIQRTIHGAGDTDFLLLSDSEQPATGKWFVARGKSISDKTFDTLEEARRAAEDKGAVAAWNA